jgi:hypothetical protein
VIWPNYESVTHHTLGTPKSTHTRTTEEFFSPDARLRRNKRIFLISHGSRPSKNLMPLSIMAGERKEQQITFAFFFNGAHAPLEENPHNISSQLPCNVVEGVIFKEQTERVKVITPLYMFQRVVH